MNRSVSNARNEERLLGFANNIIRNVRSVAFFGSERHTIIKEQELQCFHLQVVSEALIVRYLMSWSKRHSEALFQA